MKSEIQFSLEDETAQLCRESFYYFVQKFWDTLIPEEPVWNWHIEVICNELQRVAERVFLDLPLEHDLLINVPPGSTKSTLCTIFFPAWIWCRMPWARIISGSYDAPLALNFGRKSRLVIESPKYQRYFRFKFNQSTKKWDPSYEPEAKPISMRDDQDTKGFYENVMTGDRKSVGVGGNVTGSHGHFIIVDDPINPKKAVSEATLKEVNDWMKQTLSTRKVHKERTPTILIMQRLHQDDPAQNMLNDAKEGNTVRHICLPAEVSDLVKPERLKLKYVKGLLDPVRMGVVALTKSKIALGQYGYAAQFDQNPVPAGGGMFKVERFVPDIPPPDVDFEIIVRYWDKAGTKDDGDWSVGLKMGRERRTKRLWILDVVRGQWDSATREMTIKQTAILDGRHVIVGVEQEGGSGGKESAEGTVTRLQGFRVHVNKPVGDKVTRADPFSVQVNMGLVSIDQRGQWTKAFLEELRFFPKGKNDDQVDGCSGAFTLITGGNIKYGAL